MHNTLFNDYCLIRSLGWLLSACNKAVDLEELILPPDVHLSLYLGIDVDESIMVEKLGNALHVEFVMMAMRCVNRTCLGGLYDFSPEQIEDNDRLTF
jgi:hypothetical protein